LLSFFILLCSLNSAIAGEGILADTSVSVKLDVVDKYMWRSMNLWEGGAASQPDVSVTYNPLGIYLGVWSAYSITANCIDPYGDKCSSWNEHDYYIGYFSSLFEDTPYKVDYDINYTYYSFYNYPTNRDSSEVSLAISHPDLIPEFKGISLTPYYTVYKGWAQFSGGQSTLWVKAGLRESTSIMDDLPVHAYLETYYGDGGGSFALKKGFANIAAGISLDQQLGFLTFSPALNYQWALIPSPQPGLIKSQFWGGIKISVSF